MSVNRKNVNQKSNHTPLKSINIRANKQTIAAIDRLEAAFSPGTFNRRGAAIRTALIEAAARLDELPVTADEHARVKRLVSAYGDLRAAQLLGLTLPNLLRIFGSSPDVRPRSIATMRTGLACVDEPDVSKEPSRSWGFGLLPGQSIRRRPRCRLCHKCGHNSRRCHSNKSSKETAK